MKARITVARVGEGDPLGFDVCVREGKSETRHHVELARKDFARLSGGETAEALIEAAFRFLLDRESKEAILARFDIGIIARYFPEFEERLPDYLQRS